jgi:hypothetical protein
MTPGVAALGPEAVARIVKTIEDDPYAEHDFGSFEADGNNSGAVVCSWSLLIRRP